MVNKSTEKIPQKVLHENLQSYRDRAIQLGASDAKIIGRKMIVLDDRVQAKCLYECRWSGTNANCPPHVMNVDQTRRLVRKYHYGILVRIRVPSNHIAGPEAKKKKLVSPYNKKLNEILGRLELEVFQDGHHLCLRFGGGSCRNRFCPGIECSALERGQACRHALMATPSMEAVGMDVYSMVTKVGWDIYPITCHTPPSEVPYGSVVGIVLVA